ncbi:ZBBX [Branchiostoma lanceolatum]|uniref:ZBBX protein n=1 Tax=Branchiostoma lanceolatum TaxID=7740 RepID=A0A8J9YZN4_BRALA|nr:ZBBX [Branchiostoma lanceolatum]CAH1244784.1 ZBBX [Branchiostoma lanceolatum]
MYSGAPGFSFTPSNKEPASMRLHRKDVKEVRAQNLQLEVDNQEMEARLHQLKVAMRMEKEERERQGGTIWQSGKKGSLTTHAQDVLKKRSDKKPRKLKVLKDEPIEPVQKTSARSSFSASILANTTSTARVKGTPCGQCEAKKAVLLCEDCGELYCTACFAQFHMKGALRSHNAIPYKEGSSPSSGSQSARKMTPSLSKLGKQKKVDSKEMEDPGRRASPAGASAGDSSEDSVLLQGDYDEAASAASFQQALSEWRAGKSAGKTKQETRSQQGADRRTSVEVSDSGCGTADDRKRTTTPVEIHFQQHSISYMDKLLLRKHRREDVPALPTSDQANGNSHDMKKAWAEDQDDQQIFFLSDEEEEHQRIRQMFHHTGSSKQTTPDYSRQDTDVLITELSEVMSTPGVEETSTFMVDEGDDVSQQTERPMSSSSIQIEEAFVPISAQPNPQPENKDKDASSKKETQSRPKSQSSRERLEQKLQQQKSASSAHAPTRPEGKPSTERQRSGRQRRPISRTKLGQTKGKAQSESMILESYTPRVRMHAIRRAESLPTRQEPILPGGGITTQPSQALRATSRLSTNPLHRYEEGLTDFFLVGVKKAENSATPEIQEPPEHHKKILDATFKGSSDDVDSTVGFSFWRPESSVADHTVIHFMDFGIQDFLKGGDGFSPPKDEAEELVSPPEPGVITLNAPPPRRWSSDEMEGVMEQCPEDDRPPSGDLRRSPSPQPKWKQNGTRGSKEGKRSPRTTLSPSNHVDFDDAEEANEISLYQRAVRRKSCDLVKVDKSIPERSESHDLGNERNVESRLGDNLADFDRLSDDHEQDDRETLDQLEWELASQTGRVTADGQISRMSMVSPDGAELDTDTELGIHQDDGRGTGLSSSYDDVDLGHRLSEEDLMADFEEVEKQLQREEHEDQEDVKALH